MGVITTNTNNKTALRFLTAAIFILLAFPRFSIKIGSLPIYIIDVVLILTAFFANNLAHIRSKRSTLAAAIILILVFAVISETFIALEMSDFLYPSYMVMRTLIAGSLFFSTRKIIQRQEDLYPVFKAALFGAIISAIILILSSIPPTRNFANNYIFTLKFFEPSSEAVIETYSQFSGAMRGRSFIGVSILSGAFLNCSWPLVLYLRSRFKKGSKMRIVLNIASLLIPISVIMTYSRGAILGLIMVIVGIVIFNTANFRSGILGLSLIGVMAVLYLGVDSNLFYFQRIDQSVARIIDEPITDRNETERLYAYTEPFEHVIEHPHYLIFGDGLAREKLSKSAFVDGENRSDHAVFAKAYYTYGMIAAILYIYLVISSLTQTLYNSNSKYNPKYYMFSRVLFAALLGFIPWFVFGHAPVSTPRGAMMTFFIFALVSMQTSLNSPFNLKKIRESRIPKTRNE